MIPGQKIGKMCLNPKIKSLIIHWRADTILTIPFLNTGLFKYFYKHFI